MSELARSILEAAPGAARRLDAEGGLSGDLIPVEPWLDKRGLAAHLGCKVRWIEYRMVEGMPHALIAGRVKFRMSEVEPWLEEHGHLERRGEAA